MDPTSPLLAPATAAHSIGSPSARPQLAAWRLDLPGVGPSELSAFLEARGLIARAPTTGTGRNGRTFGWSYAIAGDRLCISPPLGVFVPGLSLRLRIVPTPYGIALVDRVHGPRLADLVPILVSLVVVALAILAIEATGISSLAAFVAGNVVGTVWLVGIIGLFALAPGRLDARVRRLLSGTTASP